MVILIPVLALSTALVVIWFLLLGQVSQDDWIVAAYNKVLNSRNEAERLRRKDADHARKLAQYHGVSAKVMKLFLGGNSKKEIQKLHRQEQALQQGDLRSVSLFEMPGYVIQRKFESIGRGSIHKAVLEKYSELYGKKYAVNQTKQLLARMLSYPLLALPVVWALGSLLLGELCLPWSHFSFSLPVPVLQAALSTGPRQGQRLCSSSSPPLALIPY